MQNPDYDYDTAQICLNGHLTNYATKERPRDNQQCCAKCGAGTITACKGCNAPIRGARVDTSDDTVFGHPDDYVVPRFCHTCGKPYLWTEAAIKAAQELAEAQDELNAEEKTTLKSSIDDLFRDTPAATVAASRFKEMMAKCGKFASDGFKNIMFNLVSVAIAKQIWP